MDTEYMGRLILSILVFAPGLIIFTATLFIGCLMLVEKMLDARKKRAVVNPPAGRIVSELQASLEGDQAEPEAKEEKRAG